MVPSNVYFTDFHTTTAENQLQKLKRLILTAGIQQIDFKGKFVAIKMHFGEPGNLAFLRPNYARAVADVVKELGGKPFLTDCNTLYVGGRKHALEHIDSAYQNGFTPYTTGCHVIIADGLKGNDEVCVPVQGGEYIQEAKIGRALMDADIVISLTHFKCHENAGIGGAIKNIGMGGGSRAGKMEMHAAGKPFVVDDAQCIGCGSCQRICAHEGPVMEDGVVTRIDHEKCVGCGRCIAACPMDVIAAPYDAAFDVLNCRMAEYAKAVLDNRPAFHISLVMDVSPNCDCHSENDAPIIPDVGMFASFDPVAIDQACADACQDMPVIRGSQADVDRREGQDLFGAVHSDTNWRVQTQHGKKIGLGNDAYRLITI